MAPPAGTLRVGRYFLALLIVFVVLFGLVFLPGRSHTPKLGLDLEGGTQVTFQARSPNGKPPAKSSMTEAQQIMEQRVNGYGVSNAEVVVQGSNQIVISVPGKSASDIANIGAAAVLNFRPVIMPPVALAALQAAAASSSATASASSSASATGTASGTSSATATAGSSGSASATSSAKSTSTSAATVAPASSGASGNAYAERPLGAATTTASATKTSSASATATASATTSAKASGTATGTAATPSASSSAATPATNYCANPPTQVTGTLPTCANPLASLASLKITVPTTDAAFSALSSTDQTIVQNAVSQFKCSSKPTDDTKATTLLACDSAEDNSASYAYLLGAIIVPGNQISSASSVAPGSSTGQVDWEVSLHLKSSGQASWATWTSKHNIGSTNTSTANVSTCSSTGTPCSDYVAFTLDGAVLETPVTEGTINGDTSISGGFTQKTANELAQELNYGALPLSFDTLNTSTVSASLGSGQLRAGLLAGGIGLVLVVLYSLFYYRALGFVTIASLVVSGGLTYGSLVFLGREIGFTLTLAGIAGFIVAIGITADSFVVFFERIKDEVHEGRSMLVAVPRAWVRARRTILSADTVSFLAAAILYYFATGDVRGFAFTLGLSTILDLVVVFLFTHPIISLLSRSRMFGSARFTGLDAARDGGVAVAAQSPRRPTPARRVGPVRRKAVGGQESGVALLDAELDAAELDPDERDDDGAAADELAGDPSAGDEPADEGTDAAEGNADGTASEGPSTPKRTGGAAAPRRTSTPEPGSAAERAAARRARLRGQTDESES